MNRRKFISLSCIGGATYGIGGLLSATAKTPAATDGFLMTVTGKSRADRLGTFLPHEHVITDFIGAEKVLQPQYDRQDAFDKMLIYLRLAKANGVEILAECTPAYIGRDVLLLKQLSKASGVQIITNTGYYAASGMKYLPKHAYTETSDQLAARWLNEWKHGIEGTGIRPGFIKLGMDGGPMGEVQQKLVKAAALVHLQSGLKIAIHNGGTEAVYQQVELLKSEGVAASALIWVHAQNDKGGQAHIELAKRGCWISLDGVNAGSGALKQYSVRIMALKKEGLLHKVLISHDDGFAVNKSETGLKFEGYKNGNIVLYLTVFQDLKPELMRQGMTEGEFEMLTQRNPGEAFRVEVWRV